MIRQIKNDGFFAVCNPKPFPKLMRHRPGGGIFLFTSCHSGTRLTTSLSSNGPVGEHYSSLSNFSDYEDYNEPLTIINV